MKKLLNFIKYNNAFVIILGLIFASAGGVFANEKVRDTVIGQTIIIKKGMDNTQIISADLDNFDMGLKINSVKEDDKFYYVNFNYNSIDAKDGVWQSVVKEKNMNILKTRLGDTDLGVYLAEELKQLTDREMAYMKEVQSIEKNKGLQKQIESVEYTGLKGLVFNNKTKELAGYEPVKENDDQKAEVIGVFNPSSKSEEEKKAEKEEEEKIVQQITVVKETVSKEVIMEMVREALAQEQGGANSSAASSSSSSSLSNSSSVVSGGGESQSSSSESSSGGEVSSSSETVSSSSSAVSLNSESSSDESSSNETSSSSETASSSSSESSSLSTESSSASSTSDVLPSQSPPAGEAGSSSTSDVIPAESSSSSSSASEAGLPVNEASSSSVAI